MHQIKAHDPNFDSAITCNKFVDGLKPEIKSIVLMHKPVDLDTASSLALLQEELTVEYPRREPRKLEANHTNFKFSSRPTTANSQFTTRTPNYASPEEKQHVEALKIQSMEEKMNAVKSFRRAKGLCYKCGMK